jgi:hypothetical protein
VVKADEEEDGLVRKVKLAVGYPKITNQGKRTKSFRTLERPIHKLVLLIPYGQESPTRSLSSIYLDF